MTTSNIFAHLGCIPSDDQAWRITFDGFDPEREPSIEALLAIGNGYMGTRAAFEEESPTAKPLTLIAGLFASETTGPGVDELVSAPQWSGLRISVDDSELDLDSCELLEQSRILDMLQGVLIRDWRLMDRSERITRIVSLRFHSLADRHLSAQRLLVIPENYDAEISVALTMDAWTTNAGGDSHLRHVSAGSKRRGQVAHLVTRTKRGVRVAAASQSGLLGTGIEGRRSLTRQTKLVTDTWRWKATRGEVYTLDKTVSVFTSRDHEDPGTAAAVHLAEISSDSFGTHLSRHTAEWARRWHAADIAIDGDEAAQRAIRFATYHLISAANPEDERVSLGARLLTGEGYRGHVFWDTEMFMLPHFSFTEPAAARSQLMYRYNGLPAARRRAETHGYLGAMFPWESAGAGDEMTPNFVEGPGGIHIPVLCGVMEHHIVAGVAHAAWQYWLASGDVDFLLGTGAEIILDCARFWASRVQEEEGSWFHIRGVIGPDEYHENVDNNAYTNHMAAWTIKCGIEVMELVRTKDWPAARRIVERMEITSEELSRWAYISERIVSGIDPDDGMIEQFDGFHDLEPLLASGPDMLPTPLDVLAGHERIQSTQLIKQADVVMLMAILGDHFPPDIRERNFRYYESRCNHGSSLSPATHAWVAARIGDLDTAYHYLLRCAEIDLESVKGNSRDGVHGATFGGLWQALVFGFGGVTVTGDGVTVDPVLHPKWEGMRFRLMCHGQRLAFQIGAAAESVTVINEGNVSVEVKVGNAYPTRIDPGRTYWATRHDWGWSHLTDHLSGWTPEPARADD